MISIFNGRSRGLGTGGKNDTFLQVNVEMRNYLHCFTPYEYIVFTCIALHTDENGIAWPSVDKMEKQTGLNRKTISACISKLCEIEIDGNRILVKRQERGTERGRFTSNSYLIFPTQEEVAEWTGGSSPCTVRRDTVSRVNKNNQVSEEELLSSTTTLGANTLRVVVGGYATDGDAEREPDFTALSTTPPLHSPTLRLSAPAAPRATAETPRQRDRRIAQEFATEGTTVKQRQAQLQDPALRALYLAHREAFNGTPQSEPVSVPNFKECLPHLLSLQEAGATPEQVASTVRRLDTEWTSGKPTLRAIATRWDEVRPRRRNPGSDPLGGFDWSRARLPEAPPIDDTPVDPALWAELCKEWAETERLANGHVRTTAV